MKTVNVSQAEGPVLDWMVAKCEDFRDDFAIIRVWNNRVTKIIPGDYETSEVYTSYSPSADWDQGGPIIEREGINLSIDYQDDALSNDMVQIGWKANLWNNSVPGTPGFLQWSYGPTPLIAAMRCFCCSKLGDVVDVPEELP